MFRFPEFLNLPFLYISPQNKKNLQTAVIVKLEIFPFGKKRWINNVFRDLTLNN